MDRINFRRIASRALTETRDDLRLDKRIRVLNTLIAPFISTGVVLFLTRSFTWSGVVGVAVFLAIAAGYLITKFFTVAIAIVAETNDDYDGHVADAAAKIEALEQRVTRLSAPLPEAIRSDDGVYQHGQLVGSVVEVRRIPNTSKYVFGQINDQGKFDGRAEFEYREYVMIAKTVGPETRVNMSGAIHHAYFGLEAEIIRLRR